MEFSADTRTYVDDLLAEQDAFEASTAHKVVAVEYPEFPHGEFPYDDAAFERRYPPIYNVESD